MRGREALPSGFTSRLVNSPSGRAISSLCASAASDAAANSEREARYCASSASFFASFSASFCTKFVAEALNDVFWEDLFVINHLSEYHMAATVKILVAESP